MLTKAQKIVKLTQNAQTEKQVTIDVHRRQFLIHFKGVVCLKEFMSVQNRQDLINFAREKVMDIILIHGMDAVLS